jgi:hypothetical protein
MLRKATIPAAITAAVAALAVTAMAARPGGPGYYGGTFKGNVGYVAIHAEKNQDIGDEVIDTGRVQYSCKGKAVSVAAPASFKPVPVASDGSFEVKYKGDIVNGAGKKTGMKGAVRIAGRFRRPKLVRGVASVKNRGCGQKARKFTARGPQTEG